ncbi:zinc-dependent alcohol dehydrogenase [Paenibacillus endoradicis]|uniref:zinc-dependent alcohol dehydrogenase n=1 Tax=Paenibacillus endoradicis TaxID=2972487 RepID=UPI0021598A4C|nr:zinc-binding alcohol dehydrogenase [Paenibacillus endoradicis]MCR8660404.1 zinc-binding alcohol dehydrogenase [Paenibacillus endoradicis]
MNTVINQCVKFVSKGKAELLTEELQYDKLEGTKILGKTLVSLISSGSEAGGYMADFKPDQYPMETGYAAILEVLEVGDQVTTVTVGDKVFASAPHSLYNIVDVSDTVRMLDGMEPEEAVLCRFPAISMTSLLKTQIRPIEPVLVTGLGVVGLMCAQMLQHCGYPVYAVDPGENRRQIALECGLRHVYENVQDLPVIGRIGLAVECSGAEQATLSSLDVLRKGGELSLVGVPWYRGTDTFAHELLQKIFYGFVTITSGWEWSIPKHPIDFIPSSNYGNFAVCMQWIKDGDLKVNGIYELADPRNCDSAYQSILSKTTSKTCIIYDWRELEL